MTFVEAKKTEAHQQAVLEAKATGKPQPQTPFHQHTNRSKL